jgi:hypothetical protein
MAMICSIRQSGITHGYGVYEGWFKKKELGAFDDTHFGPGRLDSMKA